MRALGSFGAFGLPLILFAWAISQAPVTASETSEAPHEQYRVLEWKDLVPEGLGAPLGCQGLR